MAKRWLSAEELVQHANLRPADVNLPQRSGVKDYIPDGSWLQEKKLEIFHEERGAAISEERIRKHGALAVGEWKPELGKVQLAKKVGRFWKDMGHEENGIKFLNREEALFLMDEGQLEICYGGLPWSLQQAYATLLGPELPIEHYQVYAHLARLGYIVHRCTGLQDATPYERQMGLDKYRKRLEKKKTKRQWKSATETGVTEEENKGEHELKKARTDDNPAVKGDTLEATDLESNNRTCSLQGSTVKCKIGTTPKDSAEPVVGDSICEEHNQEDIAMDVESASGEVAEPVFNTVAQTHCEMNVVVMDNSDRSSAEHQQHSQCRTWYCDSSLGDPGEYVTSTRLPVLHHKPGGKSSASMSKWNSHRVDFPNIADATSFILPTPHSSLLPPGVCIQDGEVGQALGTSEVVASDASASAGPERSLKQRARNWGEYKEGLAQQSIAEQLEASAVGHLWQGDVTPLVSPMDSVSTDAILDKLKIIENVGPRDLKAGPRRSPHSTSCSQPVYDVYQPDAKFAKTRPGQPMFRVAIYPQESACGCLCDLYKMWQVCNDQVPLHWAVLDHGDIAFYSFNPVDLPRDICNFWR